MMPYGYNADGSINPREADNVRLIYQKTIEYHEHPPRDLVEAVMAAAQDKGEPVTYEEAEKMVSSSAIDNRIVEEMNARIADEMNAASRRSLDVITGTLPAANATEVTPVIDPELYELVQKALAGKKESAE